MTRLPTYRSLLFVPGTREDRFDKAARAGADAIIIDLEDAVQPSRKAAARETALVWLANNSKGVDVGLRINSPRTPEGNADLAALAASGLRPAFIMVPKSQTDIDLEIVSEATGCERILAIIECGRGLHHAHEIASRSPCGILFGGVDFSASLGADLDDWDALLHARSVISAACGTAAIPAYDAPMLDVSNNAQLIETSSQSRRLGYSGRACIHPDQVEPVNDVYVPTAEELANAKGILSALEAADGGVVLFNGKMIDRPVILAAQRLIDRARP
ncbi:CoA ester lyase [Henriciella sp.]|uniref:HpcH/HpaI aldolase/citrate lyase family protein n=1 Tax=Henriciella sp. TaxID=1968823 RepID=UPI0026104AF4|nr:CoA ester lyase [Henriciella sp.]